nr:Dehydrogenase:reductase SDR family [Hymenolepis microstoma]
MSDKIPDLRGYVCLVTGASRGIGRGIAIGLGECGATVYITARTLNPKSGGVSGSLMETAKEVSDAGGVAIPVAVDHSDDSQVANLFVRIRREQHGRLDILVNNVYAGVDVLTESVKQQKTFWELGSDESPGVLWDAVNRVGLRNHYICSVLGTRMMLDYRNELNQDFENSSKPPEPQRPGLIFNISSVGGLRHFAAVAYGVGKSAVDRMTADMAIELKERNRSVVTMSIWPGLVRTEHMKRLVEENGSLTLDISSQSESPELTGRVIAVIAKESRAELMARSGRTFIVADVANSYGIRDIDGRIPLSFRSYKVLLHLAGWKRLAGFAPAFLKVPYFLLKPASPRF